MRVLCGVDGSPDSFEAVRFIGRLLNPAADEIGLYYTPPKSMSAAGQSLAEAVFKQCGDCVPKPLAQSLKTIVGKERPQHGLPLAGEQWGAELIVVGARGVGPIERLLLGSVSTSVAQSAKVPVLVVRRPGEARPENGPRVLVAYDGSEAARHATHLLERFSWPSGTVGRVMTVCESMLVGQLPEWLEKQARDKEFEEMSQHWVREHEQEKQAIHDELKNYCQKLPPPFRREPLVVEGDPADEILKAIDGERCDLAVMGARGLGAFERLLLGSTSQKVLHHAPCSVLIVREAGHA